VTERVSPTARALQALELLQLRPGATAEDLAERLGVSERAARRYVAILREAGIPVESIRGPYGGYRLGRGARLPPVVFTEEEAFGLVMAVLEGHPTATDPVDLVGAALGKVLRVLPERTGREATALRDHASAVPDTRTAHPDPAVTSALVLASAARRRVRIRYRSAAGNEWEAEVDPWSVVVRHGLWYLLCRSHRLQAAGEGDSAPADGSSSGAAVGAVRTYRIDRIRSVEDAGEPFTPPEGLDPADALEHNLGDGWPFATRVVFRAPLEQVRPWVRRPMGTLEAHPSGCVLVGSTRNPAMYAREWLAAIPLPYSVEGGVELRAAVAELAEQCAAAVASPPSPSPGGRRSGTSDSGRSPAATAASRLMTDSARQIRH
jgi:predicted DNA-binding transcriptional regulator YafY